MAYCRFVTVSRFPPNGDRNGNYGVQLLAKYFDRTVCGVLLGVCLGGCGRHVLLAEVVRNTPALLRDLGADTRLSETVTPTSAFTAE